jgi:hypothetical protein
MRRRYVVPVRWMVVYEYEVPGGGLKPKFYYTTQTMATMGILLSKEKSQW